MLAKVAAENAAIIFFIHKLQCNSKDIFNKVSQIHNSLVVSKIYLQVTCHKIWF